MKKKYYEKNRTKIYTNGFIGRFKSVILKLCLYYDLNIL